MQIGWAVSVMKYFGELWAAVQTLFANLFEQPDWRNYLDIVIIAVLIYELLKLMVRTRASSVMKGLAVLLVFAALSNFLQLNVLSWALQQFINTGVVVLVILFQPELRSALEQIGRSTSVSSAQTSLTQTDTAHCVNELVQAMSDMSRKRIGALIVFECKTGLREFVDTGTIVNADISTALIENIFEPNTPLHDGATIIRGGRILASACILQLSNDPGISKSLGTRHRAGIGITETTDAVAFIVSEETGVISMARGGQLTRYLELKTLSQILTELMKTAGGDSKSKPRLFRAVRNGGAANEA